MEIARSLVISPKFILLDEPFSGIDPITVIEIQKIIAHLKSKRIGVLITDHNVRETLQVTDRAYIINNGSIFRSGTPKELGNDTEVKRVYLGEHFSLIVIRSSCRAMAFLEHKLNLKSSAEAGPHPGSRADGEPADAEQARTD